MDKHLAQALIKTLLAMADDELILAHRNSEWTGHAPILEEDIAFSNIAQDELGHAVLWYGLLADLSAEDPQTYPDRLAFFRDAPDYRNLQLVELPKGDWAFTIVRQYLFDAAEAVRLPQLARSEYAPLAEIAAKIQREEIYHYRHTAAWLKRLGLGTEESHCRMQTALNALWPYTGQLFAPLPQDPPLIEAGILPHPAHLRTDWQALVLPALAGANLTAPHTVPSVAAPRRRHTEHLAALLADMQQVARLDPPAEW